MAIKAHPGLSWQLVPGDFLETVRQAPLPPDLIFYDMFSSKTHGEQWTIEIFRRSVRRLRRDGRRRCFTYTHSTAARAALLAAGFYVAKGRPAGAKEETTIALTPAALWLAFLASPTSSSPRNGSGAGIVLTPNSRPKFPRSKSRPSRN